jgi:DNA-binding transcriptional LysR family regulator
VAGELHFGRAAARLSMSQPPVTQHIQKLEKELGTRLFDRNKRSVKLTPSGAALVTEATRILAQLDEAAFIVKRAERGDIGRLRIGFAATAFLAGAGDIYKAVREKVPGITETWIELASTEQVEALLNDQIDLGFARTPLEHPGLDSFAIARHAFLLALPASHRAARSRSVRLSSFGAETFVLSPRETAPGFHDVVISTCHAAGFSPRVSYRARHLFTILNLVSIGAGIALVPEFMAKLNIPGIRLKRMTDVDPMTHLSVLWNPASRSPLVPRVVKQLRAIAPRHMKGGAGPAGAADG